MLNIPMLKLEKNNVYLNAQLEQQENNKQLMLDIISNIDLMLNKNTNDTENYQNIRKSAYDFLNTISNNITSLEQLNAEIAGISKELENLQSEENKNTRTKEFYIVSFSNIKNSIAQYTEKFQSLQKKLDLDNNNFNEFINVNNFKYNFESVENEEGSNSNTYKFTGFSIETNNEEVSEETTLETFNEAVTEGITESYETENEVINQEPVLEGNVGSKTEEITVEETIENNIQEEIAEENIENDVETTFVESKNSEQNNKIDELTNNFRKMLIDLSNEDSTIEDTSSLISNYFKEIHELADAEIKKENEINNEELQENVETPLDEVQDISEDIDHLENIIKDTEVTKELIENTEEILETPKDVQENVESVTDVTELSQDTEETLENTTDEFTDIQKSEENIEATLVEDNSENEYTEEFFEKPYEKIDEVEDIEYIEDIIDTPQINLGYDFGVRNPFNNNFDSSKNVVLPIEEKNDEEVQKELLKNKLEKIITATADNETLIISEKTNNIYLPYKIPELINYIDNYPDAYSSLSDVVAQEFILPFDYFMKHPYKSRFFETYNLMRNRQGNSVFSSITAGLKLMHRNDLNPAIIASCKSEDELKTYLYYLDANRLDEFKAFNIIYQVNPL